MNRTCLSFLFLLMFACIWMGCAAGEKQGESTAPQSCEFTSDCPDQRTQRCDLQRKICVSKTDADATVCPAGQVRVNGVCTRSEGNCTNDSDCKDGRCLEGVCGCRSGDDCRTQNCVMGVCRCRTNEDCPNGRCVDGECFENMCDTGQTRECTGPCGGVQTCDNGVWRPCTQPSQREICGNGRDDNCDGTIDEDCGGCTDGETRQCETECGVGEEYCGGGNWAFCNAPRPYPETCGNMLDEDCDQKVDEECDNCQDGETRECQTACGTGLETCRNRTWGECDAQAPSDELCDSVDNDCDGKTDEEVARRCDNACGPGVQECKQGQWAPCTAPETCNCGDGDPPDVQICGICGERSRTCQGTGLWGMWSDCDERLASPERCTPGEDGQQACGNCGEQTRRCTAACTWGPWQACTDEKACTPGSQEPVMGLAECSGLNRICSMQCEWIVDCSEAGPTACPVPGQEEVESCGRCGTRRRTCSDCCQWTDWSECVGEGECQPGETNAMACGPNCSVQVRTCTEQCQWGDFGSCSEGGQCEQGAIEREECGFCGQRSRQCTEQCIWNDWSDCSDQGVCAPGEVEESACGENQGACRPGRQERTCDMQCQWSEFGDCQDALGPRPEVCGSGVDEDCDGEQDIRPDPQETRGGNRDNDECARCILLNQRNEDGDIILDLDNATINGTLDTIEDVDYYCFDVDDNTSACTPIGGFCENIEVFLTNVPSGADYDIRLYKDLGSCVANRPLESSALPGSADEEIDWREESFQDDGGRYYIKIYSAGGYSCEENYTLRINGLK